MEEIFDADGNSIGKIPLSARQLDLLAVGENITVQFHTPQLLRHLVGEHSGFFLLGKNAAGHIVVPPDQVAELKRFIKLFTDIKRARES
jgi:hypothetical protein